VAPVTGAVAADEDILVLGLLADPRGLIMAGEVLAIERAAAAIS